MSTVVSGEHWNLRTFKMLLRKAILYLKTQLSHRSVSSMWQHTLRMFEFFYILNIFTLWYQQLIDLPISLFWLYSQDGMASHVAREFLVSIRTNFLTKRWWTLHCAERRVAESIHGELNKMAQNSVVLPGGRISSKISSCAMIWWNRNDNVMQ